MALMDEPANPVPFVVALTVRGTGDDMKHARALSNLVQDEIEKMFQRDFPSVIIEGSLSMFGAEAEIRDE